LLYNINQITVKILYLNHVIFRNHIILLSETFSNLRLKNLAKYVNIEKTVKETKSKDTNLNFYNVWKPQKNFRFIIFLLTFYNQKIMLNMIVGV